MIELIERTLANGGNLDDARQTLLNESNIERQNRNTIIEHDFKIAMLIRECLMTEPKGSSGYAVSKGIMNRLKEKYRDPDADKFLRKIYKTIKDEERKEQQKNDGEERQTGTSGIEESAI